MCKSALTFLGPRTAAVFLRLCVQKSWLLLLHERERAKVNRVNNTSERRKGNLRKSLRCRAQNSGERVRVALPVNERLQAAVTR